MIGPAIVAVIGLTVCVLIIVVVIGREVIR